MESIKILIEQFILYLLEDTTFVNKDRIKRNPLYNENL